MTLQYQQKNALLRDVFKQEASVESANSDYNEAIASYWTAKANFEKALGEIEMSSIMKQNKIAYYGLAALAAAALFETGCGSASPEPPPLTPVRTALVRTIDTGTSTTYSANIQPYQQVDLSFKSNGYLVSIRQVKDANGHVRNVDQGDYVRQGNAAGDSAERRLPAEAGAGQRIAGALQGRA